MLISAVMPLMSIYRLPHGQYGYKGHVINLPQDISTFATTLPRLAKDLDVLVVRKDGSESTHRDFRVRRSVVLRALEWLKSNNKYYRDIEIDTDALNQLPVDGDLSGLTAVEDTLLEREEKSTGEDEESQEVCSFVPISARKMTEEESVRKSVAERQTSLQEQVVPWPQRGESPVNEFTKEGYMSCAFPTLLPTGAGDYLAPRERSVTICNYFKHLMRYDDGRFARHPRFRYFAMNTEMRWRALQTGRVYIKQHPEDARLSVDDLRDMVGHEGDQFSKRVLHFASSLRGTRQYWFKQRSRLISMVDTLGLPTIFFTHSAADCQWPELARLVCPQNPDSNSSRTSAVSENPALADWFFYERISKFVDAYYVGILGAKDYWYRFEWQHRGSPHVHGLAWLKDAPDVEQLLSTEEDVMTAVEEITSYVDGLVSTMNPAIAPDGSDADSAAPVPKTNPHVCNKSYAEIDDVQMDLVDLIATCQRHTRCSAAYCLKTKKGKQECRFGFPKPLQQVTTIVTEEDGEPAVITARNDCLLNAYNPVQLSAWRANVDMTYVLSRQKVIKYVAKYATKSEPRSKALREVYNTIMRGMKEDGSSLQVVQKLLVGTVGERDFSAQETCHLLLQLPMYRASRDFVVLSLDGSREMDRALDEERPVTVESQLDHYLARPSGSPFEELTLLNFVQKYRVPKTVGEPPIPRSKEVVVIPRPYVSPDPNGPNYDQYCRQKLMLHQPFRQLEDLLGDCDTYETAYICYLESGSAPPSLADDIHRHEAAQRERTEPDSDEVYMHSIAFKQTSIHSWESGQYNSYTHACNFVVASYMCTLQS